MKNCIDLSTNMRRSHNLDRGGLQSASPLIVRDLCAQMAPLNRYGLPSLGVAVAEGVLGLLGAARTAVRAVVSRFARGTGFTFAR